jgi:hypothetical protein
MLEAQNSGPDEKQHAPERVVLHAGFRKAGSTSIQKLLSGNRDRFPAHFQIAARDDTTLQVRRAVYQRCRSNAKGESKAIAREAKRLAISLMGEKGRTVVISDENLTANMVFNDQGETIIDWTVEILPIYEKAFSSSKLEIVLYIRSREPWLRSAYTQEVKRKGLTVPFEEWLDVVPAEVDLRSGIDRIRVSVNCPLHVFDMEEELMSGSVLGSGLMGLLGLSSEEIGDLKRPGRRNASPPAGAIDLIRMVNVEFSDKDTRHRLVELIIRNSDLFKGG